MKSFQIVLALLASGGIAAGQQYVISTIAGIPQVQGWAGDGAAATSGQFAKPLRVTVDSKGNYYIVDYYNNVIRMVTASTGIITTISGNNTPGFEDAADVSGCPSSGNGATNASCMSQIGYARGIAVDSAGNVYIADTTNFRVRKVDTAGNTTTFAGNGTRGYTGDGGAATSAELWFPAALAFDSSGNLYVADYGSSTVRKITTGGTITTVVGTGVFGYSGDGAAASKATLAYPISLAIDSANNIYIGDEGNSNIRKVTTDGNIQTLYSNITAQSLAADSSGNLYFVDGTSSVVQKILPGGTILTIAGNGQVGYAGDGGQATSAQLDVPSGVAVDSSGNVYVADTYNQIIRLLTPVPFSVGAVANAASGFQGAVAPGEIVTLFGSGIGPATLQQFSVQSGFVRTQIAGTAAYFDGLAAPLIYASSGVVAAIVPYEVANQASTNIAITYLGNTTVTTTVPVTAAAPGIFTANSTGQGEAAALNQDGSLNAATNPAHVGSFVSLFATGEGQTAPGGIDGKLAYSTPYPAPLLPVTVFIGGTRALVTYAGAVPTDTAGIMQINAQIPAGIATGSAVPVTIQVGSAAAQTGVTIAVQ